MNSCRIDVNVTDGYLKSAKHSVATFYAQPPSIDGTVLKRHTKRIFHIVNV